MSSRAPVAPVAEADLDLDKSTTDDSGQVTVIGKPTETQTSVEPGDKNTFLERQESRQDSPPRFPIKRRRHLVNRALQGRLIAVSGTYALLTVAVMATTLFMPLITELQSQEQAPYEAWETATNLIFLHERLWPALGLALFAICLHSLWISHKIAGPLYRFSQLFRSVANREIPRPTKLRKGDFLKPEMEKINLMLSELRQGVGSIQESSQELAQVLEALPQDEMSKPMQAALSRAMARLEESVSKFTLK